MNKLKEINGKFYQEAEVVMLATNKKATNKPFTVGITLCNDCKLRIGNPVGKSESRQELYFLSNEEIKENFTGYAIVTVKDDPRIHYLVDVICTEKNQCYCKEDRKFSYEFYSVKPVITTTDTSIKINRENSHPNSIWKLDGALLPQPSQSFIQAFIKAYNEGKPITKVLVEMFDNGEEDWIGDDVNGEPFWNSKFELKINSSNEITIKKIKDSWTREEISQMLADFLTDCWNKDYQFNGLAHDEVANKWIEENL